MQLQLLDPEAVSSCALTMLVIMLIMRSTALEVASPTCCLQRSHSGCFCGCRWLQEISQARKILPTSFELPSFAVTQVSSCLIVCHDSSSFSEKWLLGCVTMSRTFKNSSFPGTWQAHSVVLPRQPASWAPLSLPVTSPPRALPFIMWSKEVIQSQSAGGASSSKVHSIRCLPALHLSST